jgi:RNA polymerase sigma factor (sigma-70 family)
MHALRWTSPMATNDDLIEGCLRSDYSAQRKLYDLYKAKVMGLCRRYSNSVEEAEDIYQETFVKVFECLGKLTDRQLLEPWIKRIAINTAVHYYHRHKRHVHADERNGYHYANDDYHLILSHFSDELLVSVISSLPDGYRIVFNLHEIEGYSHVEIARMLGISEGTSRSQLNRAKQTLQEKLRELGVLKYESHG